MLTITVQHLYYNMKDSFSQAKQAAGCWRLASPGSFINENAENSAISLYQRMSFPASGQKKTASGGKLFFLTYVYDEKKDGLDRQGSTQV